MTNISLYHLYIWIHHYTAKDSTDPGISLHCSIQASKNANLYLTETWILVNVWYKFAFLDAGYPISIHASVAVWDVLGPRADCLILGQKVPHVTEHEM